MGLATAQELGKFMVRGNAVIDTGNKTIAMVHKFFDAHDIGKAVVYARAKSANLWFLQDAFLLSSGKHATNGGIYAVSPIKCKFGQDPREIKVDINAVIYSYLDNTNGTDRSKYRLSDNKIVVPHDDYDAHIASIMRGFNSSELKEAVLYANAMGGMLYFVKGFKEDRYGQYNGSSYLYVIDEVLGSKTVGKSYLEV